MKLEKCLQYTHKLQQTINAMDWSNVVILGDDIEHCLQDNRRFFLCGNGGSLGNAIHIANDLIYPITREKSKGVKVHTLGSNPSVLSCLANDVGYEHIFSYELAVLAEKNDVLVVLSGSGNSPNILKPSLPLNLCT